MAVKIKLLRMGKIRAPHYRIVVADSRTKRDGRAIETIGRYSPTVEPSLIEVDSDRAQYWLSVGAQPTEPVAAILRVTGDWQRFRGEPGAEGTLRTAQAKPDKKAVFEAAARESAGETGESATTPRARRSEGQRSGDTTSQASPAESQASPAESQASPAEPAPAPAEPAPAAEPETPAAADAATQDAAAEGAARTEG